MSPEKPEGAGERKSSDQEERAQEDGARYDDGAHTVKDAHEREGENIPQQAAAPHRSGLQSTDRRDVGEEFEQRAQRTDQHRRAAELAPRRIERPAPQQPYTHHKEHQGNQVGDPAQRLE